jgi:hypothetical protein
MYKYDLVDSLSFIHLDYGRECALKSSRVILGAGGDILLKSISEPRGLINLNQSK